MANQDQLALLTNSIEQGDGCHSWNNWRKKQPEHIRRLHNLDNKAEHARKTAQWSGSDLEQGQSFTIDLTNASLIGKNLSGADLSYGDLSNINLSGANLHGANLSGCKLNGAKLSGIKLSNADLSRSRLIGAKLIGAKLSRAKLVAANFSRSYMSGANLSEADLTRAHLTGADLSEASLRNTTLKDANLRETNLSGADLSGAHVYNSNLCNKRVNLSSVQGIQCSSLEFGENRGDLVLRFTEEDQLQQLIEYLQDSTKSLWELCELRNPRKKPCASEKNKTNEERIAALEQEITILKKELQQLRDLVVNGA